MVKRGVVILMLFFSFGLLQAQEEKKDFVRADRTQQKLVDWFNGLDALKMIYVFSHHAENQDSLALHFKVEQMPSPTFPYFFIQGYVQQQAERDARFLVNKDNHEVYHINYSGKHVPLKEWGQQELMNIRAYYKERSELAPKFDIDRGLLQVEILRPPL